jgi:hypothetical protein
MTPPPQDNRLCHQRGKKFEKEEEKIGDKRKK